MAYADGEAYVFFCVPIGIAGTDGLGLPDGEFGGRSAEGSACAWVQGIVSIRSEGLGKDKEGGCEICGIDKKGEELSECPACQREICNFDFVYDVSWNKLGCKECVHR
jgi:hypothetical protein